LLRLKVISFKMKEKRLNDKPGFTLAELLVVLGVLGVIATFTLPKVMVSSTNASSKAKAKEALEIMTHAINTYKQEIGEPVIGVTTLDAVVPYLKVVKRITSGQMDDHVGVNATWDCADPAVRCFLMHNGGVLFYASFWYSFGGYLLFFVDPDGQKKANFLQDDPSKSVCFIIDPTGRLFSRGVDSLDPGYYDPSWFSWN
jgi:prepilin-type N-terminal cleavage/methylation domain-containing protein